MYLGSSIANFSKKNIYKVSIFAKNFDKGFIYFQISYLSPFWKMHLINQV